jgi:hypothetical protein
VLPSPPPPLFRATTTSVEFIQRRGAEFQYYISMSFNVKQLDSEFVVGPACYRGWDSKLLSADRSALARISHLLEQKIQNKKRCCFGPKRAKKEDETGRGVRVEERVSMPNPD